MDSSPNLSLPYIAPSQAQKHVTHNEAIRALDAVVQLAVVDRDLAAPPAAPQQGDRHIVAGSPTGAWAGHAREIAAWQDEGWVFYRPMPGWLAYIVAEDALLIWDGAAWENGFGAAALAGLTMLGVNATPDAVNRFALKSAAALFDHDGGGCQVKVNKSGVGDTASLVFQNNHSGRAEMGLAGDDEFRIKTSADGVAWSEAFRADGATGEAVIGNLRVSRAMVQNALPDSGRFNGNSGNTAFSGIAYAQPSYLSPVGGGSIAAHAKFIHDNADYGGAGGALDAEVKALVDKIRPSGGRRHGPEWYVLLSTNTSGALVEQLSHGGTDYGLPFTNSFTAMPGRYTVAYYVKVKTGSALIAVNSASVLRAAIDGVAVAAGAGAPPVVLAAVDGWNHVNLELAANAAGYDYRMMNLSTPAGGEIWLAMPKMIFGHVNLDPNLGILMNARMFG